MYFIRPDDVYDFNRELLKNAHEWCQKNTKNALKYNDVVVSNTFVKKWEMEPYFDMAHDLGADIQIIEAKGEYANIHNVPDAIIARMRANWETL